jgi:hypothetical protein
MDDMQRAAGYDIRTYSLLQSYVGFIEGQKQARQSTTINQNIVPNISGITIDSGRYAKHLPKHRGNLPMVCSPVTVTVSQAYAIHHLVVIAKFV